jgi:DinB superfamily
MHPKLVKLQKTLSNAITGMNFDDLSRHPEGKWSTAEILDHLNLTYLGTIKNLERRIAEGKTCAENDRRKKRWARLAVTRFGYLPNGRKSPERMLPRGTPSQQVAKEIMESLARLDGVIAQCETRFPGGVPIAEHPILGPLTAEEWRGFHLAHGCHHAKQVRALKRNRLLQS